VQHRAPALRAGLSEPQIEGVADWRAHPERYDAVEQAVLAYVEESAAGFRVGDATFAALKAQLSDPEIVDLSLVVGWYLLCAALLVPLQVELEG